jgi:hypothetical protein
MSAAYSDPRVSLVAPPKGLTIHQVHAAAAVRDYQVYPLLGNRLHPSLRELQREALCS